MSVFKMLKQSLYRKIFRNRIALKAIDQKLYAQSLQLLAINEKLKAVVPGILPDMPAARQNWSLLPYKNYMLLLDRSSHVDAQIINLGFWDIEQIDYLFSLAQVLPVQKDRYFLDIGSYFGIYSLEALRMGAFTSVCAFEANATNYAQLAANRLINGLQDKTFSIFLNAVSDVEGFSNSTIENSANRGGARLASASSAVQVPNLVIDTLFAGVKGASFVLKVDVEGHEANVIRGMTSLLSNNNVILQIELWKKNQTKMIENLHALGLELVHQIEEDFYFKRLLP